MHAGAADNPPPSSMPDAAQPGVYEVGTLKYDRKGLFKLFALLLGGDFVLIFFEGIFGPFSTLYVQKFQASNALIGILGGTVPGIVNILFGPSISRWSDNVRGPWGRRIPFLAASVPIIFGSIVLMGFAPELSGLLYRAVLQPLHASISLDNVVLAMLTTLVVVFHFGNMVLLNAYTWLQRDVIPQVLMARFLSWLRIVSTVSGAVFNWYVFPHVIEDRKLVCLGLGLFYLIVFGPMCRFIKEGQYPPPEKEERNPARLYYSFFRQCFTVPIYRYFFIMRMLAGMSVCGYGFLIFFQTETLKVSMDDLGKLTAIVGVVTALLLILAGWICDKFSPFRVLFFCSMAGFVFTPLNYFFNVNETTLFLYTLLALPLVVVGSLAGTTVTMELFPSEKFGQLFAAQNIMGVGIKIVGMWGFGMFLDYFHSNYRMIFPWVFLWDSLGFVCLCLFLREWGRLGGPENYVPPIPPE